MPERASRPTRVTTAPGVHVPTKLAVAAGSRVRPGTLANLALPAAIAASLALQLAGLYLPFLCDLLHTQSLPITDLLIVLALSTLGW